MLTIYIHNNFVFQVHYFVKQPVPEIESELTEFLSKIATLGIHLEGYKYAYNSQNVER